MSERPYHRRFHSDALEGFRPLTLEERGAYQTLLDMMYDKRRALNDDDRRLAGYMGVSVRRWRLIREGLIAKGKIYLTSDGLISNARVEKELESDAETARKLAENGAKGGRKKAERFAKAAENRDFELAGLKPGSSQPESISRVNPLPPAGDEGRYAFEGQFIRLNRADLDRWATTYHHVPNLLGELTSIDAWLSTDAGQRSRGSWFHAVPRMLARKHDELAQRSPAQSHDALLRGLPERTLTEDEARLLMPPQEFENWKERTSRD